MPTVGKGAKAKHFPYTPKGKKDAKMAAMMKKKKMPPKKGT